MLETGQEVRKVTLRRQLSATAEHRVKSPGCCVPEPGPEILPEGLELSEDLHGGKITCKSAVKGGYLQKRCYNFFVLLVRGDSFPSDSDYILLKSKNM